LTLSPLSVKSGQPYVFKRACCSNAISAKCLKDEVTG
jgi:hypothetical protein